MDEVTVIAITSDNANFVVLEVAAPGTSFPKYRHSISCGAIADGRIDIAAEVSRLRADAVTRLANWRAAQAALEALQ